MKIAIASGKGGTGKTTVSANLAVTVATALKNGGPVQLLDCDVEEPNVHLFIRHENPRISAVEVDIPKIDRDLCDGCGKCSDFCQFNAIVSTGESAMVFPDLCHACGGCALVCPKAAIDWESRKIGVIRSSKQDDLELVQGVLDIGIAMAPPVIRALHERENTDGIIILDSPPGTSCPVIAAIRGSDFVVLVTEPTPFGLHDLELAVGMVREVGLPFGVVVNRNGVGDDRVEKYCKQEDIPIIARIPDDRRIATAYSRGDLMVNAIPEYRDLFVVMADRLGISGLS